MRKIRHGSADGRWHICELQIRENLFPLRYEHIEYLEVFAAHAELEAELVESYGIAEPIDPRQGVRFGRHIECKDEAIARGDQFRRRHGADGHGRIFTRAAGNCPTRQRSNQARKRPRFSCSQAFARRNQ